MKADGNFVSPADYPLTMAPLTKEAAQLPDA